MTVALFLVVFSPLHCKHSLNCGNALLHTVWEHVQVLRHEHCLLCTAYFCLPAMFARISGLQSDQWENSMHDNSFRSKGAYYEFTFRVWRTERYVARAMCHKPDDLVPGVSNNRVTTISTFRIFKCRRLLAYKTS